MKVTRTDVAKLAGVSTATVSYVLNGSRSMSEKRRGSWCWTPLSSSTTSRI